MVKVGTEASLPDVTVAPATSSARQDTGGGEAAQAMTTTPPAVTDEMVAELRCSLDDAQLVELTMMISVANSRSRCSSALGLISQGFRDRCEIPARCATCSEFDGHRRVLFSRC
jgi:hypothetical protein